MHDSEGIISWNRFFYSLLYHKFVQTSVILCVCVDLQLFASHSEYACSGVRARSEAHWSVLVIDRSESQSYRPLCYRPIKRLPSHSAPNRFILTNSLLVSPSLVSLYIIIMFYSLFLCKRSVLQN